jgi:DNA gyrase/topoisomerase IV subunit A
MSDGNCKISGMYNVEDENTLIITEIPVDLSISAFKENLESLLTDPKKIIKVCSFCGKSF